METEPHAHATLDEKEDRKEEGEGERATHRVEGDRAAGCEIEESAQEVEKEALGPTTLEGMHDLSDAGRQKEPAHKNRARHSSENRHADREGAEDDLHPSEGQEPARVVSKHVGKRGRNSSVHHLLLDPPRCGGA